jgi:glycerol-3-phosphate acyltransferase PlsY
LVLGLIILILIKHKDNIIRLIKGQEYKFKKEVKNEKQVF